MIYMSESIAQISESLALAQGSYRVLQPNTPCATGLYANLQAILDAVQPALKDNGLSFIQLTDLQDSGDGARLLITLLSHKSGEWIKSYARLVNDGSDRANDTRNQGIRRQQASLVLGIAPSAHDPAMLDDNGDSQAHEAVIEDLKRVRSGDQPIKKARYETISQLQYDELMIELEGYPEIVKSAFQKYGIDSMADLPASEYHPCRVDIMNLKDTYKKWMNKQRRQ